MLRTQYGAKRRGDDRLTLRPNDRHVIEVVRFHAERTEEARYPSEFIGATNADCTVPLAARSFQLVRSDMKAAMQLRNRLADRLVGSTIHQERTVIERHLDPERS